MKRKTEAEPLKEIEVRQNVVAEILELLNQSIEETDVIRQILLLIKGASGIEAVGLRLHEDHDYPYYESNGFPQDFIRKENSLCARDNDGNLLMDSDDFAVLECMCGNIIRGRFDPSLPFFTEGGSFWSNCTTDLLASTTDEDRQARTRNHCNRVGYESVALFPLISHGGNIGLLQLNDHRKNMFTPVLISFFEKVANNIGVALGRKRAEEELIKHREHLEELVEERTGELRERSKDLRKMVNVMSGREVRMVEITEQVKVLRKQLEEAGITPVAGDSLSNAD